MKPKRKKVDITVYFIMAAVVIYFSLHFGYAVEIDKIIGNNGNLLSYVNTFNSNVFKNSLIFKDTIFNGGETIKVTCGAVFFFILYAYIDYDKKKRFLRKGEEHGSAQLIEPKSLKKIADKKDVNNFILSKNVKLTMNTRKTNLNLNTIVFGSPGTGKSRGILAPNLMQMNSSFVVTDIKGELLERNAKYLKDNHYDIKVFNLVDMENSHRYNPLFNISTDEDIRILIDNLMENTDGEKDSKSDPFWENAERALFSVCIAYVIKVCEDKEKNFLKVMEIIHNFDNKNGSKYREYMENTTDIFIQANYKTILLAPEKTYASVLISAGVRVSLFASKAVANLTATGNEINIRDIGFKKTALFVITSDTSKTFNFISAMLYTQIFQILIETADKSPNKALPIHVRFLLDEFKNIGKIPNIENFVATVRSRNISTTFFLQDLAQLKSMYKDKWQSIISNCSSFIFLGGADPDLLKYISERIGKETVNVKNKGFSKSTKSSSHSDNENIIARNVFNIDEIANISTKESIVSVTNYGTTLDAKFDLTKHKVYKKSGYYNDKFLFSTNLIFSDNESSKSLMAGRWNYTSSQNRTSYIENSNAVNEKTANNHYLAIPDEAIENAENEIFAGYKEERDTLTEPSVL